MVDPNDVRSWLPLIRISNFSVIVHEGPLYAGCGLRAVLSNLPKGEKFIVQLFSPVRDSRKLITSLLVRIEQEIHISMYLEYGKPQHKCAASEVDKYLVHVIDLIEGRKK